MASHLPQSMANESELVDVPVQFTRGDKSYRLLPNALSGFIMMYEAALEKGIRLVIISAYRDFDFQKDLFEDAERRYGVGKGSTWVAPPGQSEHHTGLVIDIGDFDVPEADDGPLFETTDASQWLLENAPHFGFSLSFPKDNWQGVGYEPWHWKFTN